MQWGGAKESQIPKPGKYEFIKIKKYLTFIIIKLIVFLFSAQSFALSFTESFEQIQNYKSSSLVWNISRKTLHPPLKIDNYHDGVSFKDLNIDIGTAKHGEFNISTYKNWATQQDISNQVITINTDEYNSLEFKNFVLNSGWTLRPQGSKPLIIKVQGDLTIEGDIDCSGEDGESVIASQLQAAAGGIGRCGGASGGRGGKDNGLTSLTPNPGLNSGSSVTGGSPGFQQSTDGGDGAGGGGAYSQNLTDADNGVRPPAAVGGAKGTNFEDNGFQQIGGGSGGGGGYFYTDADTALHSRGGGGGAGGGVIHLIAGGNIYLNPSSKVSANGGKGGGGNFKAGGGGGGGGGSILIFAAGEVILNSTQVLAQAGAGGVTLGGNGGNGAVGRTWITDGVAGDGPTGSGDNPVSLLAAIGRVNYQTGSFEAISSTIDTLNSFPKFLSFLYTGSLQSGDQLNIDLSSSEISNYSDDWVATDQLENKQLKRYYSYRVRLISNDESSPSYLQTLSLNFEAYVLTDFEMTTGCGSIDQSHNDWLYYFLLIPFLLMCCLKIKLQSDKTTV